MAGRRESLISANIPALRPASGRGAAVLPTVPPFRLVTGLLINPFVPGLGPGIHEQRYEFRVSWMAGPAPGHERHRAAFWAYS